MVHEAVKHGGRPERYGAADWNRTSDLVLTKDALYRLSYSSGNSVRQPRKADLRP